MPSSTPFPYLENDLADALPLDGNWEFRLGDAPPILIDVPTAWEIHTRDKITDGPAYYARTFTLPGGWIGRTLVLEAQAISFDATVLVNGQVAGHHRGTWSPFQIDLTPFVHQGENKLEIEVWKPGNRFPPRASLAGFLPDVCTTFGGIWQSITLRAISRAAFHDLKIFTTAGGHVMAQGGIFWRVGPQVSEVTLTVLDADRQILAQTRGQLNRESTSFTAQLDAPKVTHWEAGTRSPTYWVELSLDVGGERLARCYEHVAFRDIAIRDGKTLLNGRPLHLRGVLDWGWNPQRICPAPSADEVRENFAKARALGFNLFKLCLFVPDEVTFDVADEEGMLLWLEMPMWLPRVTLEFKAHVLQEYRDIFRRIHHHPSIAILSLGCELNAEADADFLRQLHDLAREWFPNVPICDNSGSAEAYGGALTHLSDFYDYHFYTDPHFFQPLVQHFNRAYRPAKPWIYGEFCDADTLRDFSQLDPEPWWLTDKVSLDRDDFLHTRAYKQRLSAADIADGGARLTRLARQQATAIRKYILEQVRANGATGGYVVTGWTDTPITTSGVVDDFGQLKFAPDEWRPFNADRVLTIDRERRRQWIGGDRLAHRDPFTWWQGERAEIHLLLSNGGETIERAQYDWRLSDPRGLVIASGTQEIEYFPGGEAGELTVIDVRMPISSDGKPTALTLNASLSSTRTDQPQEDKTVSFIRLPYTPPAPLAHNTWRVWAIPKPRLPSVIAVDGPFLHRHNLARIDPTARFVEPIAAGRDAPLVAAELTDSVLAKLKAGRWLLLWQIRPDARYTRPLPFWREAIHVFEPHLLWGGAPYPDHADMRFFSVATNFAIDPLLLAELIGAGARLIPIWRRFDARALTWADYLIEVQYGAGRMFVTTLRFEGGLGAQPDTFDANPMGAWMLAALLNTLEG